MAASAMVLATTKKKKKKKDKALKASLLLPSCYGCGAPLHTSETDAPGYVDPDTYYLVRLISMLLLSKCNFCDRASFLLLRVKNAR